MSSGRVLESIHLRNFLSFGRDFEPFGLLPLNVLIGPNGSGKSNFIEAIGLLKSATSDLTAPIRSGGGVHEWIWKGNDERVAKIEVIIRYSDGVKRYYSDKLRYYLQFTESGHRMEVTDERLENWSKSARESSPFFYFGYDNGRPMINVRIGSQSSERRTLQRDDLDIQQSVFSQRKDPDLYPEVTFVGNLFDSFQLYRSWDFGRNSPLRRPQLPDMPNKFLPENALNIGLVISNITQRSSVSKAYEECLRELYDVAKSAKVYIEGGTVQVFLEERDFDEPIPATRLSDGTLRWMSLLTILLHPSPPRLVCIEEPELGLHPDMMQPLARLLRDASDRMQLIVTTYSDALVDALSDTPESIVVCEKHDGATVLQRLDPGGLAAWLKKYSVGQLWRKGEIGGNRW